MCKIMHTPLVVVASPAAAAAATGAAHSRLDHPQTAILPLLLCNHV